MNEKVNGFLLAAGGVLILISSVLVMESVIIGKYFFAAGSLFYIISRLKMKYEGENYKIKRLNRYIYVTSLLLLAICYFQFIGNNSWIVLLMITAIVELYSTLRVSWYEKNS